MANSLEAKIVVLGSQGVGKTSLVHRYVKSVYLPPSTQSTIGASFLTKRVVDIDTSTVVRLQIWDTAGQERFRSISKLYYRGMSFNMHPLITPPTRAVRSRLPLRIVSPCVALYYLSPTIIALPWIESAQTSPKFKPPTLAARFQTHLLRNSATPSEPN
jgi:hypothetical protein